jgi:hypothetical protein
MGRKTITEVIQEARRVTCDHCRSNFAFITDFKWAIAQVHEMDQRRVGGEKIMAVVGSMAVRCGKCGKTTCLWCSAKGSTKTKGAYDGLAIVAAMAAYGSNPKSNEGYFCPNCKKRLPSKPWWKFW